VINDAVIIPDGEGYGLFEADEVNRLNIIFLGQQGSGKGEYAQRLKEKYNVAHISTGELLRDEIKKKSKIGLKVEKIINSGKLVSDEIITQMLKKRLQKADCKNGFILEGYPRTIKQAELLEDLLSSLGKKLDFVINLVVSDKMSIDRITNRRTCKKCGWVCNLKFIPPKKDGICDKCGGELYQRDDDKEEIVKKRLEEYHRQISPILNFYKQRGLLRDVDANRDYKSAVDDIEKILGEKK